MKTKHKNFTLIELLVVIAIIGILAAMLMPAISHVRKQALKTQAKVEMQSIITAVKSYESTYGILPFSGAETAMISSDYDIMMGVLTNVPSGSNSRSIRFLDVPNDYTTKGFVDPWDKDYKILIDTNYGGDVTDPDASESDPLYGTVFIYSEGPDKLDNDAVDGSDDVASWQ